jgi:hypothetical protein
MSCLLGAFVVRNANAQRMCTIVKNYLLRTSLSWLQTLVSVVPVSPLTLNSHRYCRGGSPTSCTESQRLLGARAFRALRRRGCSPEASSLPAVACIENTPYCISVHLPKVVVVVVVVGVSTRRRRLRDLVVR